MSYTIIVLSKQAIYCIKRHYTRQDVLLLIGEVQYCHVLLFQIIENVDPIEIMQILVALNLNSTIVSDSLGSGPYFENIHVKHTLDCENLSGKNLIG